MPMQQPLMNPPELNPSTAGGPICYGNSHLGVQIGRFPEMTPPGQHNW
jgi:hypothetical protein